MNDNNGKVIHTYQYGGIKVIVEIPVPDKKRDEDGIEDIKRIMNNELILQLNK